MTEIIRYSQLGKEDIRLGFGTFEVRLADGRVVTLSEIDIGALLNDAAKSTQNLVGMTLTDPKFPAVQVPSTDPNVLDDYEEGSWTPTVTFGTPGDLNVVYGVRSGRYQKIGKKVTAWFDITTTTFTHTTASGTFRITGLPFTVGTDASFYSTHLASYQGITKANYTSFAIVADSTTTICEIAASGSGQAIVLLTTADIPTATNKEFHGMTVYEASA